VRRPAQAIALLLLSGTVAKLVLTGGYLRYVRPWLAVPLLIAAAVLAALAVLTLAAEVRVRAAHHHPGQESAAESDHGHQHGPGGSRIGWLLLVPALAVLLLAPPGIGSYTAGRAGTALAPPASGYPPLPAGNPVALPVLDYAERAVFDHGHTLGTRQVRLTGFVTTAGPGRLYLTRMAITCCAADARPVKIRLAGDVPATLPANTWLEATGRYDHRTDTDPANGGAIPYLDVHTYRTITTPAQQYEG
jgi:uncharacterized repeat protein (TIGR03943 family)